MDMTNSLQKIKFLEPVSDSNPRGVIQNPGNWKLQAKGSIDQLRIVLERSDHTMVHLAKLVVYYVKDAIDEVSLRDELGRLLGSSVQTAVTFVPLRQLRQDASLIELEAISIREDSSRNPVSLRNLANPGQAFCHGITCDEFSFVSGQSSESRVSRLLYPDDLISQNQQTIENLQQVLVSLSVQAADIVKVNSWRAPTVNMQAFQQAASARFKFLSAARPAVTGITIPRLEALGYRIRLDLWAMDSTLARHHVDPPGHWGWTTDTGYSHGLQVGRWLFVGGQAALDQHCVVQAPSDVIAQIDRTTHYVNAVLKSAQGTHKLVKLNAMFCDDGSRTTRKDILSSINQQYQNTNPVATVIPVDQLAYPNQSIEFDAVGFRLL